MLTFSHMSNNDDSYSNDCGANFEVEYGVDPVSGDFNSDLKKHDDIKKMLDSNKDTLKLEGMKKIIGMIARGRDASMLFPAIVKNVVSKNIEVRKLVYVTLERYAEEQQDLALLSISTFQAALKEPNQLIRARALRVLSSIRVKMISPIVLLAIKDSVCDMSPYVRKTAAHAIPKLYRLDNGLKSELVTIIQRLLTDQTVLVIGSAVMAFTEVCPERFDLIHQVYRKLCGLIIDVDEWGQVMIVNMLTRYARMQFADPNLNARDDKSDSSFYNSDSDSSEIPTIDLDHLLLLRSTRPLLQSQNAAVVMAVVQLYHHAAPKSEINLTTKALVRLLRSHMEVQSVVLDVIASITTQSKTTFEQYLKSFFIRSSDPTNVKLLKLDILINLTNNSNVSTILQELQTYFSSSDKIFVAATIQAIGRCACSISEVTNICLNGLVLLLSNRDESVVAESVIVIKRLLQSQEANPKEIIIHMVKLLDSITIVKARAAILCLLGEHFLKIPNIAPDVLRKMAKTFSDEHEIVKLQVMNLAIKLYITNPDQTTLLCQYIFKLAQYDQNYDVRDKARLLKPFVYSQNGVIVSQACRIFLVSKPAPSLQLRLKNNRDLQLGSLSHYIKQIVNGYIALPEFPKNPPQGDVRNCETISTPGGQDKKRGEDLFSWESDSSREEHDNSSSDKSDSNSENEESSNESDSDEISKSGSSESRNSDSNEEVFNAQEDNEKKQLNNKGNKTENKSPREKSNLDLLLDLEVTKNSIPVMTPSFCEQEIGNLSSIEIIPPLFTNTVSKELLNKIHGNGLSAAYRFTRLPHLLSPTMTNVNIIFNNNNVDDISDIRISNQNVETDILIYDFASITNLSSNTTLSVSLGVDFNDSMRPVNLEIMCSLGHFNVSIKPSMGELLRPVKMSKELFIEMQSKLGGMNEHTGMINTSSNIQMRILEAANLGICDDSDLLDLKFCGQTLKFSNIVLVSVKASFITINCENVVFGSVLLHELMDALN